MSDAPKEPYRRCGISGISFKSALFLLFPRSTVCLATGARGGGCALRSRFRDLPKPRPRDRGEAEKKGGGHLPEAQAGDVFFATSRRFGPLREGRLVASRRGGDGGHIKKGLWKWGAFVDRTWRNNFVAFLRSVMVCLSTGNRHPSVLLGL